MFWKYLQKLFRHSSATPPEKNLDEMKSIWCIVANVANENEYGANKEVIRGTKHFAPGAKVYCFPPLWGDGYKKVKIIGRHRGSHQFVTMVIPSKWLTNWRVKIVYSPYLVLQLKEYWNNSQESKEQAEALVKSLLAQECDKT